MEAFLEQVGIQLNYTRELLIVALILGRTMPMVYLTPFLAGQIAPTEVKIGFGLLLTILLWPAARGAIDGAEIPFTAIGLFLDAQRGLCGIRDWVSQQSHIFGHGYGRTNHRHRTGCLNVRSSSTPLQATRYDHWKSLLPSSFWSYFY